MITTILVDDEQDAIESLQWEIKTFCKEIKVLDTFTDPEEAISAINYLKPDCVFLDIEMPKMDGFQLLANLSFRDFDLIITTAYDNYALQAFKEDAIDYLLKPVDNDDLVKVISKINKHKSSKTLGNTLNNFLVRNKYANKRIAIPMSGKVVFLDVEDMYYCKSDGNYTNIFMKSGDHYLISKKIKDVMAMINKDFIVRVHQSYLVNLNFVKEYIKNEGFYLMMENAKTIPVSKTNRSYILEMMHKL